MRGIFNESDVKIRADPGKFRSEVFPAAAPGIPLRGEG